VARETPIVISSKKTNTGSDVLTHSQIQSGSQPASVIAGSAAAGSGAVAGSGPQVALKKPLPPPPAAFQPVAVGTEVKCGFAPDGCGGTEHHICGFAPDSCGSTESDRNNT
jgi:hypothetical protein